MTQPDHPLLARKPAKRIAEIQPEVLASLARGEIEAKNLVEWLAIPRVALLRSIAPTLGIDIPKKEWKRLEEKTAELAALKGSKEIATFLVDYVNVGSDTWKKMSTHVSDVVREWSALLIGLASLPFQKKLAWMKPFADDGNSGTREIAMISLREDVIRDPQEAIRRLVPWTGSRSANLRRYASEVTRPRGVWVSHVELLKSSPELAIDILEPLKEDDVKYVKDSIGNWLNDASKSSPDWVLQITRRWQEESNSPHTAYIVRRALRTIKP